MIMNKNVIKKLTVALVITTILLVLWWLFVLIKTTKNTPSAKINRAPDVIVSQSNKAALTVNLVKPSRTLMNQNIAANGSISPWQESIIGAEVNGLQLNNVLVNVGDIVKRGQVIAEFSANTIHCLLYTSPSPRD